MRRASRALCSGWKERWQKPHQIRECNKSKDFQNTSSPPIHGCSGENHWEIRTRNRRKAWANHRLTIHSNATKPWKGKYDPLRGICSRNWQCFNCTTRILAGIPTTTLLIPGQERCTEMKQVQGRAWVMGGWACLPTADWKRMQPSKGSLKENLTAGFKYARWNERYTHGKKRTTEIRTKKLTGKEMPI